MFLCRIIWSNRSIHLFLSNQKFFRDSTADDNFLLRLACQDESKCEKVFNCSSNCGSVRIINGKATPNQLKLTAQSSGHIILFLTNSTDETIYSDLSRSFVRVSIGQTKFLDVLSLLCGWIYFVSDHHHHDNGDESIEKMKY